MYIERKTSAGTCVDPAKPLLFNSLLSVLRIAGSFSKPWQAADFCRGLIPAFVSTSWSGIELVVWLTFVFPFVSFGGSGDAPRSMERKLAVASCTKKMHKNAAN